MAPVLLELKKYRSHIETIFCCTGQHRELLNGLFDLFGLTVDYNLDLMVKDQGLSEITSKMFLELEKIIRKESPDWILAQGDTTTVMVASILSYYHQVKFGHIEAGLRTGDLYAPYPEEGNRIIADVVAHRLWAPTEMCRTALIDSGTDRSRIQVTGNTIIDALKIVAGLDYDYKNSPIGHFNGRKKILITAHRRESFGLGIENICLALKELSEMFEELEFIYPVHMNPNVRDIVNRTIQGASNIHLLEPLKYQDFIHLMKRSHLVLTDSGGIQEEAPFFDVPVLVMRDKTERCEGVEAGVSMLIGTDKEQIINSFSRIMGDPDLYCSMASSVNPYGDGNASKYIVREILEDE